MPHLQELRRIRYRAPLLMWQVQFARIPTNMFLTRVSFNSTPTLLRLSSDSLPTHLQLFSNSPPTLLQLSTNSLPTLFRLSSNSPPTLLWLSSDSPTTKAYTYTFERVLKSWTNSELAAEALESVVNGLRLSECPNAQHRPLRTESVRPPAVADSALAVPAAAADGDGTVMLYVATDGDDAANGSRASPLKSIAGAQARVRATYPTVSARPRITVAVEPGDYYMATARTPVPTGSKIPAAFAAFTAADSGGFAAHPITYTGCCQH